MSTEQGTRRALLVATDDYVDPSFADLRAPTGDVGSLAEVLGDPDIGGFELQQVLNEPKDTICEEIDDFFGAAKSRDLLLLYLSCHGVLSQNRTLYFAAKNTKYARLHSTGISESFIEEVIRHSKAQKVLLVLDCCHSGAYGRNMRGKGTAEAPDLAHRFDGRGRATLTASTQLEYAFEEGKSEAKPEGAVGGSVFTRVLVEGLRTGMADHDEDGHISLNELYDYVHEGVRKVTPHQTPELNSQVRGEIWVARSPKKVVELPEQIVDGLASDSTRERLLAVQSITALAHGLEGPELAIAATAALRKLVTDVHGRVAASAEVALAGLPESEREPPPARERPPRVEPEPIEPEAAEPEPPAAEPRSEALRLGEKALRDGRPKPALKHYDRAVAADPDSVEALVGRGWARFRLNRLPDAEEDFTRALNLEPEHVSALIGRSRALSARYRVDDALKDAERAVELDPRSAAAHTARAEALSNALRHEQTVTAIAAYDAALRIDPDLVDALVGRSNALSTIGDDSAARADVERALGINENDVNALVCRATLIVEDDPDASLRDLERALELDPGSDGVQLGFGLLRLHQERYEEAAGALDHALELNPDNQAGVILRGFAHLANAELDEALTLFRRAHRAQPESGLSLVFMGATKVELDQPEAAMRDFKKADRADPGLSTFLEEINALGSVHAWKGRALLGMDRATDALAEFDEAVAAEPRHPGALAGRAVARGTLGNWDGALADILRAAEIDPASTDVQQIRMTVIRTVASESPGKLPPQVRQELEAKRQANVDAVGAAKFENNLYGAQKQLLQDQLTGTEDLIWLCRVARETEFFRSSALLLTTEKLLECRESAVSNAHVRGIMWPAVTGVEDLGGAGFKITTTDGTDMSFTQIQGGIDMSGEGLDLTGEGVRNAVRALAGIT